MRFRHVLLPLLLAGCASPQPELHGAAKLHAETYGPKRGASVRTLIVVLHGDGAPDHYRFARTVVRTIAHTAAIAVLRPGYADAAGRISPGERGSEIGADYNADRLGAIGDTIAALRTRYPQARTIVVGDAGGAAIAANLAGIRPALIDGMVLIGCPCTLADWRQQMKQQAPVSGASVSGLDPLQTAGGISPTLRAAVLVGADDKITPVAFSRAYAEALTLRGIATDYRILPGRGHELLDDPEVLAATERLAAALLKKG